MLRSPRRLARHERSATLRTAHFTDVSADRGRARPTPRPGLGRRPAADLRRDPRGEPELTIQRIGKWLGADQRRTDGETRATVDTSASSGKLRLGPLGGLGEICQVD